MGVTSTGSTATNIGHGTEAEVEKNTPEKITKNGHDKENISASNGAVKSGNEGDVAGIASDSGEIRDLFPDFFFDFHIQVIHDWFVKRLLGLILMLLYRLGFTCTLNTR